MSGPITSARWMHRAGPLTMGLASLAFVAFLDWASGPRLDFSLMYLVPVCVVTWRVGSGWGYFTSVVSALVWLTVDQLTGTGSSYRLVVPWNFAMRIGFFAVSVLLLSGWRRSGDALASTVEQRTAALRKMTAELSAAEEAERRKLAYDMHDTFSQTLSLIKMNLDKLRLDCGTLPAVQQSLADCATMVDSVTQQSRTLMFDLYPAMLDDLGLIPTLEWYATTIHERTGAEIVVSERGSRQMLPTEDANYLFRAAKELLANALRHGGARAINLLVHWSPSTLRMVVDDDGLGFHVAVGDLEKPGRAGLGLASIRERLTNLGGRLQIESTRGQGARVIIDLPLRVPHEESEHANSCAAG